MRTVSEQETTEELVTLGELRRLTLASQLWELDRDRLIQKISQSRDATQIQIAIAARVSQPRVSQITHTRIPVVLDGFSGASPYEIAERYAADLLTKATLVDELVRWPYEDERPVEDVADVWSPGAGTFNDVERALFDRLITPEIYDAVVDQLDAERS